MVPAVKLLLVFLFATVNIVLCIYSGIFTLQFTAYNYLPASTLKFNSNNDNNNPQKESRPPTLVLYVFSDAPGSSSSADLKIKNLDYFIHDVRNGVCEDCSNVDYVFLVNGYTSYSFPTRKNVRVIYRTELGCGAGDFEAWGEYLTQLEKEGRKYKRIMFLNDTVRGPYIDPLYAYDKDFHFTDVFARLLTNETKIVGSYLNCGTFGPGEGHAHIQSMAWMTDDVGLSAIRSHIKCYPSRWEAVNEGEIGMSKKMIQSGYNIATMLMAYRGVDFRKDEVTRQTCNSLQDPTYTGTYYGQTVHPLEVVFFKDTRDGNTLSLADTYSNFFSNMKAKL